MAIMIILIVAHDLIKSCSVNTLTIVWHGCLNEAHSVFSSFLRGSSRESLPRLWMWCGNCLEPGGIKVSWCTEGKRRTNTRSLCGCNPPHDLLMEYLIYLRYLFYFSGLA